MRLLSLLRRFRALGGRERFALVPATAGLIVARLALRALPLRKVLQWIELPAEERSEAAPIDPQTERLVRAVERAAHGLFPHAPCLTQAVVVQRLLRKRGHASDLRIGVRKVQGNLLEAHAWIEYRGVVVIGARGLSAAHTPLPPLPMISAPKAQKWHPRHPPL